MSGTAVLERHDPAARPSRISVVLIVSAMLAAVLFVAGAALPYFTFLAYDAPTQYLDKVRFELYYFKRAWLLVHILGGMAAVLTGPVQLWLGLSDRRPDVHRRLGIAYLAGVGVGTFGAIGLAVQTDLGAVFGAGLLGLSVAWVVTTSLAFCAIRRGLIEYHKEWMIRSYVTTFAFVTFRIGEVSLRAAGMGDPLQNLALMSWACWAVPLLATEAIIQGRKIFAVQRIS